MERRAFLVGGSVAVVGLATQPAASQDTVGVGQPLAPGNHESAVARLRKQFHAEFDPAYVENDVVFEVFHNFVALSQWGNTIYNITLRLAKDTGTPQVRASFKTTMEGKPDDAGGNAFTPLERFVMELFRVITIGDNVGFVRTA